MKRFVVVGNPVAQSLSPQIHAAFADQCGDQVDYRKQPVELDGFDSFATQFAAAGGAGMNVTVPFKGQAYAYADHHDELAGIAGAANTLSFVNGECHAYNTDGPGLLTDLQVRWQVPLQQRRVLLLGAGGASRGVILPLLRAQPAELAVANRTVSKAQQLIELFRPHGAATTFTAVALPLVEAGDYDVVINATSLGLETADLGTALGQLSVAHSFCYDMSYAANARFCVWAAHQGCAGSADGLGMLVEQAAVSYAIWHGHSPDTGPVYQRLREQVDAAGSDA